MLIQPTNMNLNPYSSNKISFRGGQTGYQSLFQDVVLDETIEVKDATSQNMIKKTKFYKYRALILAAMALLGLAGGYLIRPIFIRGENNKIENLGTQIDSKKEEIRVLDSTILSNKTTLAKQQETITAVNDMVDVEAGRIYVINDEKLGNLVLTKRGLEQYAAIDVEGKNLEYLKKQWKLYEQRGNTTGANNIAHEITELELKSNVTQLVNILKSQGEIPEKIFNNATKKK